MRFTKYLYPSPWVTVAMSSAVMSETTSLARPTRARTIRGPQKPRLSVPLDATLHRQPGRLRCDFEPPDLAHGSSDIDTGRPSAHSPVRRPPVGRSPRLPPAADRLRAPRPPGSSAARQSAARPPRFSPAVRNPRAAGPPPPPPPASPGGGVEAEVVSVLRRREEQLLSKGGVERRRLPSKGLGWCRTSA